MLIAVTVARTLRVQTGHLPSDHPVRGHLEWMVATCQRHTQWPPDKRWRWLGYVAGALACRASAPAIEQVQWQDHVARGAPLPSPEHERAVREATAEVLAGLRGPAAPYPHLVQWIERLDTCAVAVQESFWLGGLQAHLETLGVISVSSERDRTRPIFHRCYVRCGWPVPESMGR